METLSLLWTFAPDIKVKLLALAIAGQVIVTLRVYGGMSKARFAAVKAGEANPDTFKLTQNEPVSSAVFTRAVANQFELPVLFFAIVIASLALGSSSWLTVILAFAFVIAKAVHIREFTTTNTVLKRRKLFIRSVQVLMLMLAEFVISALLFAQG